MGLCVLHSQHTEVGFPPLFMKMEVVDRILL